jgi:TolB-like protein/AraC-like DNA-binding protein/TPR repeat protein
MSEAPFAKNEFLTELNTIVEQNMANEQFGVSELAEAMNMSRSNLLRKVKKEANVSVSQLISQARLNRAMELLKTTLLNVSEVSHQTGFNSPSYFIKCFRERFGYPPGEIGKRPPEEIIETEVVQQSANSKRQFILIGITTIIMISVGVTWFLIGSSFAKEKSSEKAIVVLPFKNESNDSTNVYLINGLMEATLNNLQKMKELKVISRTSAEKYRNTAKSIPEIAKELNVNYFVEGSGQKIGNRILLNIQLIDAVTDKHLWAKQYRRETKEIFELQEEIARNIADEIEVIISPEENERLEMKPTDNLVAYDAYLKGSDLFYKSKGGADLLAAVPWFKKAIEEDPEFGLAYANLGIVYYYLDIFQVEKKYTIELSTNADKALLYAPKSDVSLIVKALDYASKRQFKQAVPYFEKALEYNPNSGLVLHFLNEFYSMHVPNPAKHLEVALKRVKADMPPLDSNTAAFNYFHLSNALFENGFLDEATEYVNKSMAYNPNGFFTAYFRVYVLTMKDNNLARTKAMMLEVLKKDTSRFDIVQEVGKICFMMRDYGEAFKYYKWFAKSRERMHVNLYKYEDLRLAIVFEKMGLKKDVEKFVAGFKDYADNDLTIYKNLHLTYYWCYRGDKRKALDHLKLFANEKTITYAVTCLADDPLLDQISSLPEFKSIMAGMKATFNETHDRLAEMLKEEGLP